MYRQMHPELSYARAEISADGPSICWMANLLIHTIGWDLKYLQFTSTQKVTPGKHTIKFDFAYEGGRGGGGTGTISLDGNKIGEGKIAKTNSNTFGIDESADVGTDENTPVFLVIMARKNSQERLKRLQLKHSRRKNKFNI